MEIILRDSTHPHSETTGEISLNIIVDGVYSLKDLHGVYVDWCAQQGVPAVTYNTALSVLRSDYTHVTVPRRHCTCMSSPVWLKYWKGETAKGVNTKGRRSAASASRNRAASAAAAHDE